MIEITCDLEKEVLNIRPSGQNFQDIIEDLKTFGAKWNKVSKYWNAKILDLKELSDYMLSTGEVVEVSELTWKQYRDYVESFRELNIAKARRPVNYNLMHFPPLKGKAPFENYQSQDIGRAIIRNRFLFNWTMGLGKSYALACLIENLRYYKLIDKCIIMSTGVGVYNLKDELCKFGKNFSPDEIFVINSTTTLNDRDLFNPEKYPYKIIIMTYDTFKGISDYYYDMEKRPKTGPKKVEQKELEIKEYTKQLKAEIRALPEYLKIDDKKQRMDFIVEKLDNDEKLNELEKELSALRKALHPSQTTRYDKGFMPLKEWFADYPGAIFLDECHSLAHHNSRRSEIVMQNLSAFSYRYLFTGTLADKYEKLYIPLKILDRSLINGKSYNDWLKEYNDVGNEWSVHAVNPEGWDMGKIAELNKNLLDNYAAKRTMIECLDLPLDYDVPTINIEMSPLHRKIYEAFVKVELELSKERKLAGEATQKDSIMNMFGIFQLACENVECIRDTPSFEKFPVELQECINNYDWFKDNAKVPVIETIVDERINEDNERGIVWYYHPKTKDSLMKLLKKYNPIVIEAGMGPELMSDAIKQFKSDDKHKIIIASINIMNTSVTLTECKWNLYVERTFNYTIYSQSRGRIYRPGQKNMCRTYMMCFNNSIDNLQLQNLKQKGAVIDSLLNKHIVDQSIWRAIFNAKGTETW